MTKRIAVVGAGAVGGYIGGFLAHGGHNVTLIDPWPEHVETVRARGLELFGMSDEERLTVKVPIIHLTELHGAIRQRPFDIAIVSTKSYDTAWATTMIAPYLAPDGYIVSAQNCINEPCIASIVGWGKTVGCVVGGGIGVELFEPGHIRRSYAKTGKPGSLIVGEVHSRITDRIRELAEILGSVDVVTTTTNLWGERWSKLCVNGMRNAVSAATGLYGNARDQNDASRGVGIKLGGESVRVGQALGYDFDHVDNLDAELLARASEGDKSALEKIEGTMLEATKTTKRSNLQRPSMAQDIAKGRRTEIEQINGYIAKSASEIGITAPTHEMITALVKRIERGDIAADPSNLL
jgi:2-dehydropantoate 2-reductase